MYSIARSIPVLICLCSASIFLAGLCNVRYRNAAMLIVSESGGNMVHCSVPDRKTEIIDTTWKFLLKRGLEHASVGELCRETGLAQSSLYHYFENKDDILLCAGKYGLSKVVDALFAFTFAHLDKVDLFFDGVLDEAEKYKEELRLGVQITTSPVFGPRMRDKSMDFNALYDNYAGKLIEIFHCTHHQAEVFIYSVIAYIVDFAIWDDREKTQMLFDNLKSRVLRKLETGFGE